MPVKSIRFPNQTTYDGKITSLTEKEKEVLKKAVGDTRHGYMVIINNMCQYTVFTTKNYNFQIGKVNEIDDFKTNDNYKELRAPGTYPASGSFTDDFNHNIILSYLKIKDGYYRWTICGYELTDKNHTYEVTMDDTPFKHFSVAQLY